MDEEDDKTGGQQHCGDDAHSQHTQERCGDEEPGKACQGGKRNVESPAPSRGRQGGPVVGIGEYLGGDQTHRGVQGASRGKLGADLESHEEKANGGAQWIAGEDAGESWAYHFREKRQHDYHENSGCRFDKSHCIKDFG